MLRRQTRLSCDRCHCLVWLGSDDHWTPGLRILLRHMLHGRSIVLGHVWAWLLLPSWVVRRRSIVLWMVPIHRSRPRCHWTVMIAMVFPPVLLMQRDPRVVMLSRRSLLHVVLHGFPPRGGRPRLRSRQVGLVVGRGRGGRAWAGSRTHRR